ncbi:phosphoribosyltransferase [Halalkalicoccus jeotgali]|uniref:Phosphoribosyltransferase n=1 Tax=Halalkalicoccus jeotgali (strain DSM 18796 / CECT 7217 / JCM 14584 / KCTC 4019 / B3) TaxID=795797 RepID=D8J563_HALJB|nr:phosphoribosyltransferase family protein [Halalkalicoccus jeotgali]ADJ13644.1 phosphoribosyltransferase [Halalkalicoccus jeotgali B3]ELY33334.1 phosphoribosyltransferase [Halalkalicoccus jeotgali B3]
MSALPFADRTDAGERLADLLEDRGVSADRVLAIPRGGLPVGRAVADALSIPLDVIVARKVGAPDNPELAIGAVGADGSLWRNDALIHQLNVPEAYVESRAAREAQAAREKRDRYRGSRGPLDLAGEAALIVDDGIATGATAVACIRQARAGGARRVALAAPVAPPEVVADLETEADDVLALVTPADFGAVGRFYRSFDPVADEVAMGYLDG